MEQSPEQERLPTELSSDTLATFEALLLASDDPITSRQVAAVIDEVGEEDVPLLAEQLDYKYHEGYHGIMVQRVAGGWRLATRMEYAEIIKRHLKGKQRLRLSRASLEAVSIVAYRQPISRAEIEEIRGVDSSPVLRNLLDRGLIRVKGRADAPGRPLLYATTDEFLIYFGLDSLDSLPKPEELPGSLENGSKGVILHPNGPFDAPVQPEEDVIQETPNPDSAENREIDDDLS